MKSYFKRSILFIVILLSQLGVAVSNIASFVPGDSTALELAESSMPCHETRNAESTNACCSGNCDCPAMSCAPYLLTLDSDLLKFSHSISTPKYDPGIAGEVVHSVNPLFKPPISV